MKLINNLWTDENNNTWPADIGEAEAARRSATLVNCGGCRDCTDCADCADCTHCTHCTHCRYCRGCADCADCAYCTNCTDCAYCANCRNCTDCTYCANCRNCTDCTYCTRCTDCADCTDCTRCAGFKSNPNRYAYGPIGSRNDTVTAYWTSKDDLIIVAGCFSGTEKQFLEKVKETHGDNEHAVAYRLFAQTVLSLITVRCRPEANL